MKKLNVLIALIMVASLVLAACTPPATVTEVPPVEPPTEDATATPEVPVEPTAVPTPTEYPLEECAAGKICVTWFVGLGTGTSAEQIATQEEVVADFNASQSEI